jgi:hypothetical protein
VNELGKKMTVGGEGVRYKYSHCHPQNSRGLTDPRASVLGRGGSMPEHGGSAQARADKNSDRLAFVARII